MKRLLTSLLAILATLCAWSQQVDVQTIKLMQAMALADNYYVDTVSTKRLSEAAIRAIMKELDPHCSFIPADEVEKSHEGLNGNFEGIGVTYMMMNDSVVVDQTVAGCPAGKVGILPGDRITRVDTVTVSGMKMSISRIPKLIRGPKGTTVAITVARRGVQEPIVFKVVRDKIPITSVDAAFRVAPTIGYIKVSSFSLTTPEEFTQALSELQAGGPLTGLIIDLQSNGGGIMNSAVDMVSRFVPRGREIVSTRGVHLPKSSSLSSGYQQLDMPLCVLIDEYTASASEIVAGALQDWDRATIVGRRSFGKGLVQRPFNLQDGSEVRLTIARYYTPSGRNIQKPYDGGTDKYFHDIENRYKHGELESADSVQFPDSLKYQTLTARRTVYGGGGIFPDVFIPLDTTRLTALYRQLAARGVINRATRTYTDLNRKRIQRRMHSYEDFARDWDDNDALERLIVDEARAEKIEYTDEELAATREVLLLQCRALVAQSIYGMPYYYHVVAPLNDALTRAVAILRGQ